jgi:hypothetical protein
VLRRVNPPTFVLIPLLHASAGKPAFARLLLFGCARCPAAEPSLPAACRSFASANHAKGGLPPVARVTPFSIRERRVVAREGLEPSKPLGRQIYSLLRLTASLPRRDLAVLFGNAMFRSYSRTRMFSSVKPMELAKGFEPPTG